jgi:hypothetical protein
MHSHTAANIYPSQEENESLFVSCLDPGDIRCGQRLCDDAIPDDNHLFLVEVVVTQ